MELFIGQPMVFGITDNGALEMRIDFEDLEELFNSYPKNSNGKGQMACIRKDKKKEFLRFIVAKIMDASPGDKEGTPLWDKPFDEIFDDVLLKNYDFCIYSDDVD